MISFASFFLYFEISLIIIDLSFLSSLFLDTFIKIFTFKFKIITNLQIMDCFEQIYQYINLDCQIMNLHTHKLMS